MAKYFLNSEKWSICFKWRNLLDLCSFLTLLLVAPWNQRGRISWNIVIVDDIVFLTTLFGSDVLATLHTAINILQYLKHCQWGLKLLHHPHHGIPTTNQLLDLHRYISFSYDLSLLRTSNLWRRQQWSNSKNWKKVSAPRFNVVLSHLQSCSAQWVHAMPSIIEKHYFFASFPQEKMLLHIFWKMCCWNLFDPQK